MKTHYTDYPLNRCNRPILHWLWGPTDVESDAIKITYFDTGLLHWLSIQLM